MSKYTFFEANLIVFFPLTYKFDFVTATRDFTLKHIVILTLYFRYKNYQRVMTEKKLTDRYTEIQTEGQQNIIIMV